MEGFTSASSEYRMDEPTHSLLNGPVTHTGHLYENYVCHDFKAEAPSTTVRAGAPLTVEWDLEAKHPGDCDWPPFEPGTHRPADRLMPCSPRTLSGSLYISYDDDGGTYAAPKNWIKLAVFPGCVDQQLLESGGFNGGSPPKVNTWRVEMPAWLPSSSHAVLRWEWTALHVVGIDEVEFYATCVSRPRCHCIQLARSLAVCSRALALCPRARFLFAHGGLYILCACAPLQVLRRDCPGHCRASRRLLPCQSVAGDQLHRNGTLAHADRRVP